MDITEKLLKLTEINNAIQLEEIEYENGLPYYKIEDHLKDMYEILSINGCNEEFDAYIKKECLDYINKSIKMSREPIPQHLRAPVERKEKYMPDTIRQLKHTSTQCIRYLKYGHERFCAVK